MGSITLTVEGTTVGTVAEGGGIQIVKTVSEQDSARLMAAYAKIYAGRWTDENGDPRQPTYEEIVAAWWEGIVAGSVAAVKAQEQTDAAQAARDGVTDIAVA